MTTVLEWQFGGWLRPWPAPLAWGGLAVVAGVGLWLVFRSYQRASGAIRPGVRLGLASLRGVMLGLLLLCLANPTRVSRNRSQGSERKLTVLVDVSASMTRPDHRGVTRLAEATRLWKQHEPEVVGNFTAVNHVRFASSAEPVTDFGVATKVAGGGAETHLYAALQQALAAEPAALVCLTDGLDTTGGRLNDVMTVATERRVPLYFVVGNNRLRPAGGTFKICEVKIPSRVLRQSRFTASALVEILATGAGEVPLELWQGNTRLAATNQPVREGVNSVSWAVEVAAGEPGLLPLEFRLGGGTQPQVAGRTARIVENTTVELLYYQGALQWGYRFLRGALESDPGFRVAAILNPALGVRLTSGLEGQAALNDLPEDARELQCYQIVVLAHAFADLLTPGQQRALLEYARNGGGVLFISPDTEATQRFSGSAIEQMLPVVFERPGATAGSATTRRFQEQMRAVSGAAIGEEAQSANQVLARQPLSELKPFQPTQNETAQRLFRTPGDVPRFDTYAKVRAVKPGAEILAVHPTERTPEDNTPRVLVARQQFGQGFTAVMNTDLLWRWKMSLPSTNRAVEIFWQQFFLTLARPVQTPGVELTSRTGAALVQRPVTLRVAGGADVAPMLIVRSPQGKEQRLGLTAGETEGAGVWQAAFTPDAPGAWEAKATGADGDAARISIPVTAQVQSLEQMNLPPDAEGLRRLAEATGGALIESSAPVFAGMAVERPGEVVRTQPLWNNGWLVMLLLGAYAAELATRRFFNLL